MRSFAYVFFHLLLCLAVPLSLAACCIEGFILSYRSGDQLLLLCSAIFPPIATLHGLGHFIGFWP